MVNKYALQKKAPLYQKILRSLLNQIIKISAINQTATSSQPIILRHSGVSMAQIVNKTNVNHDEWLEKDP